MTSPAASFCVRVDASNPGQFFACCALLELSSRLPGNAGAQGWFEDGEFCVASRYGLPDTVRSIVEAEILQLDADDDTASPLLVDKPFDLTLDWWKSDDRKVTGLKVWAGRMSSFRIARAMQQAMREAAFLTPDLLNIGTVARDPEDLLNKVEPFCFDARRAANAHSRDTGFSIDALGMTSLAFPAVELLCLVGLQRCLPVPVPLKDLPRHYDYFLWDRPIEATLLLPAVAGLLADPVGYRFESWFRTSQRKHKAFLKAKPQPSTQTRL